MKTLPEQDERQLTLNVCKAEDITGDDDDDINIGSWYLVDDELIWAPDPRVDDLPTKKRLTPTQFLTALVYPARGPAIEDGEWEENRLMMTLCWMIYQLAEFPRFLLIELWKPSVEAFDRRVIGKHIDG